MVWRVQLSHGLKAVKITLRICINQLELPVPVEAGQRNETTGGENHVLYWLVEQCRPDKGHLF